MNARRGIFLVVVLIIGVGGGWFGSDYLRLRAASSRALIEMGQIDQAAKAGDLQRAIMYATRATTLDPQNHLAFLGLAELYERAGHKELAIAHYQEALRLLERDPAGAGERSHIERKLKQLTAAQQAPPRASTEKL
jgi:Tfp pilus assembly protein PilF